MYITSYKTIDKIYAIEVGEDGTYDKQDEDKS